MDVLPSTLPDAGCYLKVEIFTESLILANPELRLFN